MNDNYLVYPSRRTFLKISASAMLTSRLCPPGPGCSNPKTAEHHILVFLQYSYRGRPLKPATVHGKLIDRAVDRISHIMRDHRTGEIKAGGSQAAGSASSHRYGDKPRSPINIISGYRSPSTNESLRKVTTGVAPKSLHMEGRAIDIRIPGYPTSHFAKWP
jgi:uncharacterized protein YcbK (DUF882 family)